MNRIVALCLSLVFAGVVASAQELTKEAKIERILALSNVNASAILDQMKSQIKSMSASVMPPGTTPEQQAKALETQGKMLDSIKTFTDKIRPQLVTLYGETFSAEEIDGILAFYQSPAGHALLDKTPVLMSKMTALMAPELQRLVKEMVKEMVPQK